MSVTWNMASPVLMSSARLYSRYLGTVTSFPPRDDGVVRVRASTAARTGRRAEVAGRDAAAGQRDAEVRDLHGRAVAGGAGKPRPGSALHSGLMSAAAASQSSRPEAAVIATDYFGGSLFLTHTSKIYSDSGKGHHHGEHQQDDDAEDSLMSQRQPWGGGSCFGLGPKAPKG
jgi:hypothetical protein